MLKPHRIVLDKVSSYTDEAAAFMRRRRHHRREFIRIRFRTGAEADLDPGSPESDRVSEAARRLIELG
ncbi:MAG: hypothetical protein KDB48_09205 [Solirubrobacterales bacterium]|nr:hypothetical protein [Solirubrobacterales bacterium]HMT04215.1 hypothetical protein [Solirubrobacterales bacterium]